MAETHGKVIYVLFVCLGNICRSPMAEGVFRQHVERAGLAGRIKVDSAGLGAWHVGEPPHPGTARILAERGIQYAHRARVIHTDDFTRFDYVIAVERAHANELRRMSGSSLVRLGLLLDYAPQVGMHDLPDPYYNGRFREVHDMVEQACRGLLEHIIATERLVVPVLYNGEQQP